jgi:hypothetical protein
MKLTRTERGLHERAETLLQQAMLTDDECESVLRHWHPGHAFDVGASGAFFTPFELAREFRIDAGQGRIIDLCAGIGSLAYWCLNHPWASGIDVEMVCVELNPTFVEIGKKLVPDATWICADIFDAGDMGLGSFDIAISNPPFGRINRRGKNAPRYRGSHFEYHVIDIASELADVGAFIVPQTSAPFRFSGRRGFERAEHGKYQAFHDQTAIELDGGVGIDTSLFQDQWKGASPQVEIATTDFTQARASRMPPLPVQLSLLDDPCLMP